jgi:hypothetical protein
MSFPPDWNPIPARFTNPPKFLLPNGKREGGSIPDALTFELSAVPNLYTHKEEAKRFEFFYIEYNENEDAAVAVVANCATDTEDRPNV